MSRALDLYDFSTGRLLMTFRSQLDAAEQLGVSARTVADRALSEVPVDGQFLRYKDQSAVKKARARAAKVARDRRARNAREAASQAAMTVGRVLGGKRPAWMTR